MKKKRLLIFLALFTLLLLAASPLAPDIGIDWWAIGPGSSRLSNAGTELHGMVGQGVAGEASQSGSELCSGYLCLPASVTIRLPLILK